MISGKALLACATCSILVSSSAADTLKLKDGRSFPGTLETRRDGLIWFFNAEQDLPRTRVYAESEVVDVVIDEHRVPRPTKTVHVDPPLPQLEPVPLEPVRPTRTPDDRAEDPYLEKKERLERVRSQWRDLAQFISMKNELYLENVTLDSLKGTFQRISAYRDCAFDSHPSLQIHGPPIIRWLVASEGRIIPIFRANPTFDDVRNNPEGVIGGVLLQLVSMQMENNILHAWQVECDTNARESFKSLMPLVRSMAPPINPLATGIRVSPAEPGSPGLVVRNDTERPLTNATIVLELRSLDDRSSMHYFFLPTWNAGEIFEPRAAADWWDVGLTGTVEGTVQVFSNELAIPRSSFRISENVKGAMQRSIPLLVRSSPMRALKGLNAAKALSERDPELNMMIEKLRTQARANREQMLKSLRAQLAQAEHQLNGVDDQPSKPGRNRPARPSADVRATVKQQRDTLKRQIADIKIRINELQ